MASLDDQYIDDSFLQFFCKYCHDTSFNNLGKFEKHLTQFHFKNCSHPLGMLQHCSHTYCTICKVPFSPTSYFSHFEECIGSK